MSALRKSVFLSIWFSVLIAQGADSEKNTGGLSPVATARMVTRSTAGATLKSPLGATRIGAIVLYDRLRSMTVGNAPLPKGVADLAGRPLPQAGGEAFELLLDREQLPPRTQGSVDFYVDGGAFFPIYLKAIAAAKSSVDVQTFIFDNDDFAVTVADALRAKSREVPVRVYLDANGSARAAKQRPPGLPADFQPPKNIHSYLAEGSAVQVRRSANPYLMADHTKLHIIDGHTAFLGGMNIGREYRYTWHDLMAKVEGPVVQDLIRLYERRWRGDAWWRKLGPKKTYPQAHLAGSASSNLQDLRILTTDSRSGRREVLKATLLAFRCASRRIWLQTPYFSSDEATHELADALRRGVDVRIIIPSDVDYKIMEANNAEDVAKLLKLGAKVYLWPGMTHLKATVVDDWATFGSANYDTLSQRINVELNLATSDRRTVDALATRVFAHDFRVSRRLTPAMAAAKGSPFAEFIGDQL